jgi:hypothetical protein
MRYFDREGLNLKVDAGDLRAAIANVAAGTLAKFGEPDMRALAQFEAGSDQHAVDFDASLAFEFE